MKDIHDFDGVHSDWLKHAAVTLVVHHHHEEITAGDLLDHKGPANHSTDRKKDEEGRRKRKQRTRVIWIASGHGARVECRCPCVSEDLCYKGINSTLAGGDPLKKLHWMCQEDSLSRLEPTITIQQQMQM